MTNPRLPDLTFPSLTYGSLETPWDLLPLLYRGGSGISLADAAVAIRNGSLGRAVKGRLPLVTRIHDAINGALVGGGTYYSTKSRVQAFRSLFAWADLTQTSIDLNNAADVFTQWVNEEVVTNRRAPPYKRVNRKKYSTVAAILDEVLGTRDLIRRTRLQSARNRKLVAKADTVDLSQVFSFGALLVDLCEGLSVGAIWGQLPIIIPLRTGETLTEWSRLVPEDRLKHSVASGLHNATARKNAATRLAWAAEHTRRTRYSVMNLRLEAELLIFIAQTGMNLAQAHKLRAGNFRFRSHLGGYQVLRTYKARRSGQVEFWVYSEYRPYFERYLQWRNTMFGEQDDALFPISCPSKRRAPDVAPLFTAVRKRCNDLSIPYFGPRVLRRIRTNWVARQTADPSLAADMAQHTLSTFFRNYDRPSHQVALVEISKFHSLRDPALNAAGPGACLVAVPKEDDLRPIGAPYPDCVSPAGCLFCTNHRDVDSFDHVWSLASYRHLKTLELTRYRPPVKATDVPPAMSVIDRLASKLRQFLESQPRRAAWVSEAVQRTAEGHFHPKWSGFIALLGD